MVKIDMLTAYPIYYRSIVVADPEKERVLGLQYDLLANITHEGDPSVPGTTSYKVHLQHRAKEQWYQIQDLFVEEINAQMIFLSESYIQVRGPHLLFLTVVFVLLSFSIMHPCPYSFAVWFARMISLA